MRARNAWTGGLVLVAAVWLGSGSVAVAGESEVAPQAEQVMKQVSAYFTGLDSFSVEVAMAVKVQSRGMKSEMTSQYAVAMKRPNLLAMVLKRGMMGSTIVCDGERIYAYLPMLNKYTVSDAPGTLEEIFTQPDLALAGVGMQGLMFVDNLMREDPYASMMDGVTSAQYLGVEEQPGPAAHHLKFIQEEFDWDLWVQTGETPLILKVVPDISKSIQKAVQEGAAAKDMKFDLAVTFKNWKVNPDLPEDTFAFAPPKEAERVDSFFPTSEERPSPLLGKPAPDFTLSLLDGGQVRLSDHKGKNIVILDFWATWCPPCRKALPVLLKVTEAYKDKGVLLYGVNQGEKPGTIRRFLEKQDLKLVVALDSDGKVGDVYGAQAIPQTVIVGKDGTVQAIHVGLLPDLEKRLKKELDALLAGQDLAAGKE